MGTFLGGYSGKDVVNSPKTKPTKKIDFSNFLGINWTGKTDKKTLEKDLTYDKGSGYQLPTTGHTFLGGYFGTDEANNQAIRRRAANTLNKEYNTIGNNNDPVEKQSGLNYYNDPYQINSILDVFNRSVLRHNFNIGTEHNYWSAFWKGIGKAWENNRVKGKPLQTAFNNLMAIGEDMDILGNPVKAITTPTFSKGVAQMDYQDALEIVSYWQNKEEYNRENAIVQATEYVNEQLAEQGLSIGDIDPDEYQRVINETANQLVEQWDNAAPTYDDVSGLYTFTTQNGNVWRFTEKEYHNIVEDIVNSGRTVNPYALSVWKRLDASTFAFDTDYGHLNYNYQTGSTLADIALEIVSDPENWVTFGSSALATGAEEAITKGSKGLLKHADLLKAVNKIDDVVVDAAKNKEVKQIVVDFFNKNKNIQRINRQALDYARDGVIKATSTEDKLFLHGLTKQALSTNTLSNTFSVTYDQALKYTLWKTFKGIKDVDLSSAEIYKLMGNISIATPNQMTNTILKTLKPLNKVKEGIDNTQKALLKAQLPLIGGTTLAANLVRKSPAATKWIAKEADKIQHCFIKPGADIMSSEAFDDVRHIIDEFVVINKAAGIDIDGDELQKAVVDVAKSKEVNKLRTLINVFDTDSKVNFITAVDNYIKDTYHDYKNWTEFFESLDEPSEVYEQLNSLYTLAKDTPSISMALKQKQILDNMLEALRNGDFDYVKLQLHNIEDDPVLSKFFKAFGAEADEEAAVAWLDMLVGNEKKVLKTTVPTALAPIIKYLPGLKEDSDALNKLIQAYFDYDEARLAGLPYVFNNPYIEQYIIQAYTKSAGDTLQESVVNKLLEALRSGDFAYVKSQLHNVDDDPVLSKFFKAFDSEADDDAVTAWLDMLVGKDKVLKTTVPTELAPITKYFPELEDDPGALDKLMQDYFDFDEARAAGKPYIFDNPYIKKYITQAYAKQCVELNLILDATDAVSTGASSHNTLNTLLNAADTGASSQALRINKLLEAMGNTTNNLELTVRRTNLSEAVKSAITKDDLSGLTQAFGDLLINLEDILDKKTIVDKGIYSSYAKVLDCVQDVKDVAEYLNLYYFGMADISAGFEAFVSDLKNIEISTIDRAALSELIDAFDDLLISLDDDVFFDLDNILYLRDFEGFEKYFNTIGYNANDLPKLKQTFNELLAYLDSIADKGTFDNFVKYLNTMGDNDAGISRYENIVRLLNVLDSENVWFTNALTDIPTLRNILSDIADPYERITISALETTIQLKVEASTALYQLMQDKSTLAIQDAITSPNSTLHKYLTGFKENDPKYAEAQEILHMFDSTDAVRTLYRDLDKPGMREDVSAAVKQAIQRVYGKSARDVLADPTTTEKFLKDIIDSANTTLREVSKEVKSYSVEELYNTLMASKHPDWKWVAETHLSESDIVMQHALIELLPDVQKLRDEHGYTLLTMDWETANEQTNSIANVMLNWAGMTDNGKSNKKLHRSIVEKYFPAYSYLQKNFDGKVDKWVTAMSDAAEETAAKSEDDLIVSFYKYLTEQYNESGQKLCVLGHNSNRFDLTLLTNKVNNNRALRLKIAAENADPDILSKCKVIDTLQEIQRIDAEKGMFSIINESEEANIRAALLDYLSAMSDDNVTTNRMFSLLNSSEMRTLNGFLSDMINDIKYADPVKEMQAMLTEIKMVQENIGQYFEALNDIRTTNMALNNNPILLSVFKEPTEHRTEIRAYITDVLKAKYPDMSDPEIEALINSKFGKNLELVTPTKITALEGLAFKYHKDIDTMYDFLDPVKVKAADLSDNELSELSSLCRKLNRHRSNVNIKLIADNYEAVYEMVKSVVDGEPISALLNERMAPANLGALFYHYYYRAVWASGMKSAKGFSAGYIKRIEKMAANLQLFYDLLPQKDVITALNMLGVGIYDWDTLCSNGIISETLMWAGIRHDLNTNLIDLPEYSRQLEHLGIAAADSQAKYAVLRPVAELAAKVKEYWSTLAKNVAAGEKTLDAEQMLTNNIKQKTFDNFNTRPAKYFMSLKQEDKINWLAHSGGLCIVPGKGKELEQVEAPIIGMVYNAGHNCTIYYLTKEANYRIMRNDDTVRYFVKDVEYETAPWVNKVDTGINTQPITGIDIQPHLDTLAFHTNGNSCLSTMSTLNNEQYNSFIQLLPKEVLDDFTPPHEFWVLGNIMNHTDYSGKYVPMAGDMYARTITATSNVVQNHNSINNYIAAFMQKGSELKNTELGKLFMSSPLEARQYLKEHPEYVLAACVPDAKSKVGYTIIKYHPDNVEEAIEKGAYLFEDYVVDRMISAVNQGVFENNKIISFIQKFERLYKVGYLIARPATSMRNFKDTIIKTRGETGEGYISILSNYAQALHEMRSFKKTMKQVYELRNKNVPLSYWLKSDAVKEVCKNSGISYDWFIDMYRIMQESSINGEISVIAKATAKQRQGVLDDALSKGAVTKTYRLKHSARQSFNTMCNVMLNDMGQVEQVARLAQYNILKERGATIAERFKSIKHAQFNYEVKSPFVQKAELFMPFFNFQANNMIWWYDTFANNFWLINELSNILGPALDLGQYNPETLDDPDNIFTSRNTTLDNILDGNIPINDNTYLVTGNSLFDLLGWVDPLRKMHDTAFSPVMDLIDYLIDIAILPDASVKVSEWLFENFGHDLNEAAVQKRFGDWADNYMQYREDYEHQHSLAALRAGDVSFDDWIHSNYYKFSYIPVVGTLIGNMINAGYYLADHELNKALSASKILPTKVVQMERDDVKDKASHIKLYYQLAHLLDRNIAGVRDQYLAACKELNIDPNCNLYALDFSTIQDILQHMQASLGDSELSLFDALYTQHSDNAELAYIMAVDADSRYLYSRLKYALGYGDTKLSECPEEVQRVLYHYISDGFVPHDFELNITSEDLQTFWNASLKKYNVADVPYDKIPTPIVNKMFEDVTKSCVTVTQIIDAFDNIPGAGYAFAQVRDSLGMKGLKLNQWPSEYLEVALNAIVSGKYNQYHWSRNKSSYIPGQQKYTKQYHRKTYAHKYYSKYREKLDKHGMYLNYSHDPKIYEKQFINYSKHGFGALNKIQSTVYQGMSPSVLSQIRKDLKYKFY